MQKYYYAVFEETEEAIEVFFPKLKGCNTFGKNWEEAYEMATDALAGWLSVCKETRTDIPIQKNKNDLKSEYGGDIVPIPVDEKLMQEYDEQKRFNVIFPASLLNQVDQYRSKHKVNRSLLLRNAVVEYMDNHA